MSVTDQDSNIGGQGDDLTVLSDEKRIASDAAMIRKAIRLRWPIPADRRDKIVNRLASIVEKTAVDIPVKDGCFTSEYHADGNAIAASRVLAAMEAQNQSDEHQADKNARIDGGLPTESIGLVGVNEQARKAAQSLLANPALHDALNTISDALAAPKPDTAAQSGA